MKYTANILNEIPFEKRKFVLEKMKKFEEIILNSISLADIPKGFWVRRIVGTDTYKIRVNNGDRILFKFVNDETERSIIYTSYCCHDSQIRIGKSRDFSKVKYIDDRFEIDRSEYDEDDFDEQIKLYVSSEMYMKLSELQEKLVLEDEYIALASTENDMQFLSIEQFECLKYFNKALILLGCAGSGKTNIAIKKMQLNYENSIETTYITMSKLLKEKTIKLYESSNQFRVQENTFLTYKELCLSLLDNKNIEIIEYNDFFYWINDKLLIEKYKLNLNSMDIWGEINQFIKGKTSLSELVSLKEYLKDVDSDLNESDRRKVYNITQIYQSWLLKNNYYDDNDITRLASERVEEENKIDFIIFDEFQELNERQINLIFMLSKMIANTMFLGDINQIISFNYSNIEYIKNYYYKNKIEYIIREIYKNYRNTDGIIEWINLLNENKLNITDRKNKTKYNEIISIKDGNRPNIFYNFKNEEDFFNKVANNVDSIVIVSDEEEKHKLKLLGLNIGRIFTLHEVRGLDYKNIYCYNIASNFHQIWNDIFVHSVKNNSFVKYFNKLYLAATRAKSNLYFLEDRRTKLNDRLNCYCNILVDESKLYKHILDTFENEKWIVEAKKLELQGSYMQASEAYKKGGQIRNADICLKAYSRKKEKLNLQNFKSSITLEFPVITEEIIENSLKAIKDIYNINIGGFIDIIRYDKVFKVYCSANIRIALNNNYKDNAKEIYNQIRNNEFDKSRIEIVTCFYRMEEPIDFSLIFGNEYNAIIGNLKNNKLNVELYSKNIIKAKPNYEFQRSDIDIEKTINLYEEKSAQDILDFIFKN